LTYHFEEHGKAKYFNLECWVSLQLYNNSMEKKLASMTEELSNSDIMHAFFLPRMHAFTLVQARPVLDPVSIVSP
jgi:hypothetical protein